MLDYKLVHIYDNFASLFGKLGRTTARRKEEDHTTTEMIVVGQL
jgi:hypothetical protein